MPHFAPLRGRTWTVLKKERCKKLIEIYWEQDPQDGPVVFRQQNHWLLTRIGHRNERVLVDPVELWDGDGTIWDGDLWQRAYYLTCKRYVPASRQEDFLWSCHNLTQLGQPAEATFRAMASGFQNDFGIDLAHAVEEEQRKKKSGNVNWIETLTARRNRRVAELVKQGTSTIRPMTPVIQALKKSHAAGRTNILVTGCVGFLINPLMEHVGLNGNLHGLVFPQALPGEDLSAISEYPSRQYASIEAKPNPGCYLHGLTLAKQIREQKQTTGPNFSWSAYEDTINGAYSALRAGATMVILGQPTYDAAAEDRGKTLFALKDRLAAKMRVDQFEMPAWQHLTILSSWELLGVSD